MNIALLDPYFDESHKQWAQDLQKWSGHNILIYYRPRFYWKWKMAGGALELADEINESNIKYDLILATDMVNIPLLRSRLNATNKNLPIALYFHENQITYPWSSSDPDKKEQRDHHYGLINFHSALSSDVVYFNSQYHKSSFLGALPDFLSKFPKFNPQQYIQEIASKSHVLPIGITLPPYIQKDHDELAAFIPKIIWNHRWEEDKNPIEFYEALKIMKEEGEIFELVIAGKSFKRIPKAFDLIKTEMSDELIHCGYVESRSKYIELLRDADILLVTSHQDFFGISVVEAIAHGCWPILPNRLAYPEHIPKELMGDILYNDKNQMINLLRRALRMRQNRSSQLLAHIQKYNWISLIQQYDSFFQKIVA